MITLEQVEKLREKANVSYDEAKAALEATNGDLLDALIYLEKKGTIAAPAGGGYYNSSEAGSESVKSSSSSSGGGSRKSGGTGSSSSVSFMDLLRKFGKFCSKVIHIGNINTFEVHKGNEIKTSIPLTVLALALIFIFWITVPLIIIGLFFGFHYRFSGPDLGKESVNEVMESASNAAENLKKSMNSTDKSEKNN